MLVPRRLGVVLAPLLVGLAACTGGSSSQSDNAQGSSGADTSSSPSTSSFTPRPPTQAIHALGDRYPRIAGGKPLPEDVTAAQLRTWVDDGRLPPGQTQSMHFETMINALGARDEAPDVMLFGDSMTQQGIDPQVLGDELGQRTGTTVTAFDAATSKARWGVNRLIARHLVQTGKVPDVAVLVISTRAAGDDPHYTEGISKTPFSSVVEGCDRHPSTGWKEADYEQCRADVDDLTERFRGSGAQVDRARKGEAPQTSLRLDDDTWLRSDGYMIHPSASRASVEKAAKKRVADRNAGLPSATTVGEHQFRQTARLLEENGATVIATEIPYSPPYQKGLEKESPGYDKRRQDAATTLTEGAGVEHFPVKRYGDWWGDGDSRDEIHLAPQGAGKFTRQLLEDVPGFRSAITEGLED